jgi:hypothetical protein
VSLEKAGEEMTQIPKGDPVEMDRDRDQNDAATS